MPFFLLTTRTGLEDIFVCLLVLAPLGLCCYAWPFSSFGAGATQVVVCRLLIRVASLVENKFQSSVSVMSVKRTGLSLMWDVARPGIKPRDPFAVQADS